MVGRNTIIEATSALKGAKRRAGEENQNPTNETKKQEQRTKPNTEINRERGREREREREESK
jgi:hypothetical protein